MKKSLENSFEISRGIQTTYEEELCSVKQRLIEQIELN